MIKEDYDNIKPGDLIRPKRMPVLRVIRVNLTCLTCESNRGERFAIYLKDLP